MPEKYNYISFIPLSTWQWFSRFGQIPYLFVVYAILAGIAFPFSHPLLVGIVFAVGIAYSIAFVGGSIVKMLYYTPRPVPYPTRTFREKTRASSFPSMHAVNSAICAMGGAILLYGKLFIIPHALGEKTFVGASILYIICLCIWVTMMAGIALSRIVLQKHYPRDVFWGAIGGIFSLAIAFLLV